MERFTPDEPIHDRYTLFNAPEKVINAARFILDRIYFDVPHVIETEE